MNQQVQPNEEPQKTIVVASKLTKVFRDFFYRLRFPAVQGLDLEIRKGDVFGLLGPNGSGKTTTIKILLGLISATSGSCSILGRSPRDVAVKARIGFLPEESYFHRFLSAEETLNFYGSLFGLRGALLRDKTHALLKSVGLENDKTRLLKTYSKGMTRRVGIAQSLIGDPELLIFDEPTSGLDPIGMDEVKELLLKLKAEGKTILIASHMLSDVQDVCDRVAILFKGKKLLDGKVRELRTRKTGVRVELPGVSGKDDENLAKALNVLRENGVEDIDVVERETSLMDVFLDVIKNQKTSSGV
ncbi:MAG: ABC transporter ATP-binding protein [Planctomycetes bacterium]|nr:ABC transporter ATP-binding protein [Planctomycetota bacterium]